jgi:dinuclear metal center YbgI/SA1388 family protein
MTGVPLATIADHLDTLLRIGAIPDYPNAVNGIQLAHRGPVTRVAASVDFSRMVIERTIAEGANLLIVHHGMFWGGLQPLRGAQYERVRLLIEHDIAVYAAHLPLDAHPDVGNNVLLARELHLVPTDGFAAHQGAMIGVRGSSDIETIVLIDRARAFAQRHGGDVRTTSVDPGRRTRRWAICTGAGASASTLAEAAEVGIDTLIVGEGPHWTAVDAPEAGLVIVYAGHYATETLGVSALATQVADVFDIPWSFIEAPTGL